MASARPRTSSAQAKLTSRSWHRSRASSPPTRSSRSRSRPRKLRRQCRPRRGNRLAAMSVADLTRNTVDVLPKGELERKLELGRPLRVKLGIDPTAPDIHLGFAYVLDRLAEFQAEGHIIVLIVGDYTARIGDPSGRSDERPVLPGEVLDANAKAFAEQAFRVLDRERTEIRFNGEWLGKLSYAEVVRLARTITVARILERDDFAQRFAAREPISISELLYPLMQAYDSVATEADIEIGGTDQLYNLLAGRDVMQDYGLDPQLVMTYPLLVGGGPHPDDPMQWKLELARRIVSRWHGEEGATRGEDYFTRVVRDQRAPEEVAEVQLPPGDPVHLPALLVEHFGVGSTSEARRLISQGGVKIDGRPATEIDVPRARLEGALVQAGKRRFMRFPAA